MAQKGRNVEMTVKGNKLTIVCDLTEDFGPSKSGKTNIVASTDGNIEIPGHENLRLGFNIYKTR
jgi:hypothetical protein